MRYGGNINNKEVCEYVNNIKCKRFICNLGKGYGQSCGGYYNKDRKESEIEHFIFYYKNKEKKFPSYNRLRCPQLMLFIAEIAGVSKERLDEAKKKVIEYEDENHLKGKKDKNGNYIYRSDDNFKQLKEIICINEVNNIIRDANCWDEVREKVKIQVNRKVFSHRSAIEE